MGDAPGGTYERPPGPLVSKGWVIACVIVSLFVIDYAQRQYHRPLCVDACARVGQELRDVSEGGGFLNRMFKCRCAGGTRPRLYVSWREYFNWFGGTFLVAGALLAMVVTTRALWRGRRAPPS